MREPSAHLRSRMIVWMGSVDEQEVNGLLQAAGPRPVGPMASKLDIVRSHKEPSIRLHYIRAVLNVDAHKYPRATLHYLGQNPRAFASLGSQLDNHLRLHLEGFRIQREKMVR